MIAESTPRIPTGSSTGYELPGRCLPIFLFLAIIALGVADASTTLYWGGGTADKVDGASLPVTLDAASVWAGTWNGSTKNWSSAISSTEYQAWSADSIASFGYSGQPTPNSAIAITVGTDLSAGGIDVNLQNNTVTLSHGATLQTITLTGDSPAIRVASNNTNSATSRLLSFGSNVRLAGTSGFTFGRNPVTTSIGNLAFTGNVAHSISGSVNIFGSGIQGIAGTLRIVDGQFQNITDWNVLNSGNFYLDSPDVGNQNRIANTATLRLRSLGSLMANMANDRSETIGTLDIANAQGRIQILANGNAGTIYQFGTLNRGVAGVLGFENLGAFNGSIRLTNLGAVPENVSLPWAFNRASLTDMTVRFVEYNEAADSFRVVASDAAPAALGSWGAGSPTANWHYDNTTALTGALAADVSLRTLALSAVTGGGSNNLDLGGNTLSVQGLVFGTRNGVTNTISNGYVTTSAGVDRLYLSATSPYVTNQEAVSFNAVLGSAGAVSTRTNDVIIAPYLSNNNAHVFRFTNDNDYNYVGTMHILGAGSTAGSGGFVDFRGSGRKVTGDLSIEEGGELRVIRLSGGPSVANTFSPTTIVTIQEGGGLSLRGSAANAGNETVGTIGGLVGDGRLDIGVSASYIHGFTINTAALASYTFDGTFTGLSQSSASLARITKTGDGTQKLNGTITYTQNTFIESGTWVVNGTHTNAVSGRGYSILSSGTLAGGGVITLSGTGTVTLEDGGTIAPGDGEAGTLALSSLSWNEGGELAFELGATPMGSDYLNLGSGALTKGVAGAGGWVFHFDLAATNPITTEYKLIGFGSSVGFGVADFSYVFSPAASAILESGTFDLKADGLYFNAVTIPEAGRSVLALLGLAGLILRRRRVAVAGIAVGE